MTRYICATGFIACLISLSTPAAAANPVASPAPAVSAKQFAEADRDANGSISKEEFEAYFRVHPGALPPAKEPGYAEAHGFGAAPTPGPTPAAAESLSDIIAKYVSVHKSFLSGIPKDALDPARLGWSAAKGTRPSYTLDLAIQPKNNWIIAGSKSQELGQPGERLPANWELAANAIFETHVSTVTKASKDQILYQGLLALNVTSGGEAPFVMAHHLYVRPMYETDRQADVRKAKLDIDYSPDLDVLFWGQQQPLRYLFSSRAGWKPPEPREWQFYFRPFFGLEFNSIEEGLEKVVMTAKLPELEDDFGFFRLTLSATLLMTDRFALTASWVHRTELYGSGGSHNYLELTGLAILDQARHYSLGLTYKRGEDSPLYEDLNVVEGFVGVQF